MLQPSAFTLFAADRLITDEELTLMSGVENTELVKGKLVKRMPTGDHHGAVAFAIAQALGNHLRISKSGKVRFGEVGIYTRRNPDSRRAADAFYISTERYNVSRQPAF